MKHTATLRMAFPDARKAEVVANTLAVDDELQPDKITKAITTEGNVLVVDYAATEHRLLRVAVSSMFDSVNVASKTVREFA